MFNSHKIDGNTTLPEVCNLTFFKISQMLYGKLVVIVLVPRCYRGGFFRRCRGCGFRLTAVDSRKTKWQPTKYNLRHK